MRKFRLSMERRHILEGYVFVLPFVVGIIAFFLFPLYVSIKLSFGELVRMVGFEIQWTGLDNFKRAFLVDIEFLPMFLRVINQTLLKAPLIIIFSVILAILVNKSIRFRGFFRTVFFIPFLLGTGGVMQQLLDLRVDKALISIADGGLIPRELLMYLGPTAVSGIDTFFGIIVAVLWSSGVQILLVLSGLQNIPVSLYESAKIDGATGWEMFWKITLPMLSPVLVLVIIYTLVDSFTGMVNPILSYIKEMAFINLDFEYAAAMGWIYFAFIILMVLLVMAVFSKKIQI
ncbi:carbohydrate ABC transporter permease [Paenibacillus eucommiae]|uniref:ABC-type sugar transport system permease subunit n=1 Tax=Paenibacillus eucommiae TaxID=1355755 RepID=A0ABS4IND6_9BACL|nr:sugar ABC transporter permease [Paenibacillus eucommiae]MBP1989073.1 ABC-type sugar transport system permease subunit [Paenibacillus eucommiae]